MTAAKRVVTAACSRTLSECLPRRSFSESWVSRRQVVPRVRANEFAFVSVRRVAAPANRKRESQESHIAREVECLRSSSSRRLR